MVRQGTCQTADTMKGAMRLGLLLLLGVLLTACQRDKEKARSSPAARAPQHQPARRAIYQEPDALAILQALDSGEIVTSEVARATSQNDEVLRYAAVLIKDHSDMMHLVDSLGAMARRNAISARITHDADSVAKALGGLTMGFNNTYIEEQVRAHQKALQLLDTAVIPSVQTPQLRTLLEQLRPAVAAHLQRAMQIYALRKKEAEANGEPWLSGIQAAQEAQKAAAAKAASGPALLGRPAVLPRDTHATPPTTTMQ
jgi:putative membrane protein